MKTITPTQIKVVDDLQPQEFAIKLDAKALAAAIKQLERREADWEKRTKRKLEARKRAAK